MNRIGQVHIHVRAAEIKKKSVVLEVIYTHMNGTSEKPFRQEIGMEDTLNLHVDFDED